jgi:hypothetical protein
MHLRFHIFKYFWNFVGPSEAGEDVRRMAEEIEGDLHKLTDQTKERCASLESCLAQIDNYQKVWHLSFVCKHVFKEMPSYLETSLD